MALTEIYGEYLKLENALTNLNLLVLISNFRAKVWHGLFQAMFVINQIV